MDGYVVDEKQVFFHSPWPPSQIHIFFPGDVYCHSMKAHFASNSHLDNPSAPSVEVGIDELVDGEEEGLLGQRER